MRKWKTVFTFEVDKSGLDKEDLYIIAQNIVLK